MPEWVECGEPECKILGVIVETSDFILRFDATLFCSCCNIKWVKPLTKGGIKI